MSTTPIHDQLMVIQNPPFPPLEIEEEANDTKDDQNLVLFFGASSHSNQSSISGISTVDPGGTSSTTTATELQLIKDYDQQLIHDHHQATNDKYSPCSTDESSNHQQFLPAASSSSDSALLLSDNNYGLIMKSSDEDIVQEWRMPLKIRFMRKYSSDQMAAGTHHQESVLLRIPNMNQEYHHYPATVPAAFDAKNGTSTTTTMNNIRVCSDCSTTKTPLWRGGPRGPKSLCNACGIRQRKARRAMAAAAAATGTNNNIIPEINAISPTPRKVQHMKEKKTNKGSFHDQTSSAANKQEKKQCNKLMKSNSNSTTSSSTASCSSSRKKKQKQHHEKLCFEDWVISLSENHSDFHSVFPQDEKEAAILLMALSCGLVYG